MEKKELFERKYINNIGNFYLRAIQNSFIPKLTHTPSIEKLDALYQYIELISKEIYHNGKMSLAYMEIQDEVSDIENIFHKKNNFILPTKPQYSKNLIKDDLDEIIYDTRTYLSQLAVQRKDYIPINPPNEFEETQENFSFLNYCYISSKKVQELCNKKNIKGEIIGVHPGFSKSDFLYGETKYHFFNLIKYNDSYYIVDCAYRQFFLSEFNLFSRLGIVKSIGLASGFFMIRDEERKKLAEQLIQYGKVPYTQDNLKKLMDGFALSYRNGIYYEKTGDYSFQTDYTAQDYERFLIGEDSQVKHENRKVLEYLKKPTKIVFTEDTYKK